MTSVLFLSRGVPAVPLNSAETEAEWGPPDVQFPLPFSIAVSVAHWVKRISTLLQASQPGAIHDFGESQEKRYPQTMTSKGFNLSAANNCGVWKDLGTI